MSPPRCPQMIRLICQSKMKITTGLVSSQDHLQFRVNATKGFVTLLNGETSVRSRDFKSKMQTEHIELLQSPWLIELGAFHLNCDGSDIDEPVGFFKNGFLKNFSCDLTGTQPLMTVTISETMKYEYSLTCPICLDTLFNTYALSYGHLFCKGCACGAASVYIFQGIRSAPPEANCPTCRTAGVFAHAVHMTEIDLLIKTRSKDYWRQRLHEERTEMVKQSKGYWESQSMLSMGI